MVLELEKLNLMVLTQEKKGCEGFLKLDEENVVTLRAMAGETEVIKVFVEVHGFDLRLVH